MLKRIHENAWESISSFGQSKNSSVKSNPQDEKVSELLNRIKQKDQEIAWV